MYEDSTAVIDDLFVGLPLDEDFESEKNGCSNKQMVGYGDYRNSKGFDRLWRLLGLYWNLGK